MKPIHEQIIDEMVEKNFEYQIVDTTSTMISEILLWAQEHPKFNTTFIDNLANQEWDYTTRQIECIENIYQKWHIQDWIKRNLS